MTAVMIAWALFGIGLGAGHVLLLRRAALAGPSLAGGALRLLLSGGGLVLMAVLGGLWPGAAGWGAGFAVVLLAYAAKEATCRRSKSSAIR